MRRSGAESSGARSSDTDQARDPVFTGAVRGLLKTIHFILAVVIGWYLADHREFTLLQSALWTLGASVTLTLLTLVVQHWTIPPASRSRRGLTVFQGQLTWLFFGTIATIVATVVVVLFVRQQFG